MLLFCDTDSQGNIIDYLAGKYVIPQKQYDYFFYLTEDFDVDNLHNYQIENGELIKKEVVEG